MNRHVYGVATSQQYITFSVLNRLWYRLKRNGLLYKIEVKDKNYLYLALKVLKTNGLDRFKSFKIVKQLRSVVTHIQSLTLYAFKVGSSKLHEMVNDVNYFWAEPSLRVWLSKPSYCLTVGLKELKYID